MEAFETESLMDDDEFRSWFDDRMEEILFGDGVSNTKGLLSVFHKPEPAKLPEKLTRQLRRQQSRLLKKGRAQ